MGNKIAKKAAGLKALDLLIELVKKKPNFHLGLGTGTSSIAFIEELIKHRDLFPHIKCIASSKISYDLASPHFSFFNEEHFPPLDLYVDGADEVDEHFHCIKGGGAALARERILWKSSEKVFILIDESKRVKTLGSHFKKLPLEILAFGCHATIFRLGLKGAFRNQIISDNGNPIFDVDLTQYERVPAIPRDTGIVEIGHFTEALSKLIIGKNNQTVEIIEP